MGHTALRNALIYLFGALEHLRSHEKPERRIIALHDIPKDHERLFLEKIEWLQQYTHIVSLSELARDEGLSTTRINVALTFDDGFKEYSSFIAPTLQSKNIPATFFIPSGALDLTGDDAKRFSREGLKRSIVFEFMTTDDLRAMAENPLCTIGGHTTHHKDVATLDAQGLEEEITRDKQALEQKIGKPIEWFAYPFGGIANISAKAIRTIHTSGYAYAFSILPSFWKKKDYRLLVGRDSMSVLDPISLWNAWLHGGYDFFTAIKQRSQARALLSELKD